MAGRRRHVAYSGSFEPAGGVVVPSVGEDLRPELADIGRLVRRGLRSVVGAARAADRAGLSSVLLGHLGSDGAELEIGEETWAGYEHVNVQAGLDAWLAQAGRTFELVGVVSQHHEPVSLTELLLADGPRHPFGPRPGNAATINLASGPDGEVRACVRIGLYLVREGDVRTAVLLRGSAPEFGRESVSVQAVSIRDGAAARALAEIRAAALEHNVFRGHVLSFGQEVFGHGQTILQFHRRPTLDEGRLILAPQTLAEVRRQVVEVARHKDRLLAAGQHIKRGLLLYGPPGVGKTHTVRFLMSSLVGTTVIQLTGGALHLIREACSVARALQPAMVIVEDVDLIAEERDFHDGPHPLLFQLLNEMDGLAEDVDVVFVLTTNRPDLLEPALAARPGRVDQAVALELPDAGARRALVELYRGAMAVDMSALDEVIDRTEGVTASFVKELLRRSALLAATRSADDGELRVSADDLRTALDELLDSRNAMTRTVLGSGRGPGARPVGPGVVER